ncbi:MAG: hypothetical protein AAB821_03410 [Patescibacteria group bacterium]
MKPEESPIESLRRIDSTKGPVVATFIIIAVLLMGAVVVFSRQYETSKKWQADYAKQQNGETVEDLSNKSAPVGTSTAIEVLEKDLADENFADLGTDIEALSTEI